MSQSDLSTTVQEMATNTVIDTATQEAAISTIIDIDLKVLAEKGPDLRKDHPRGHGLYWGEFKVEDNLPELFRVGVFAQPITYPIWVRPSNGSPAEKRGKLKSDLEPDVRALAIKLLNVTGEKVLDDEQQTQDFLFINHPVFFTRDAQGFANLTKASVGQATEAELRSLAPTFEVLKTITSKQVANPLLIQYWSATPYRFGSQVVKFSVKPHHQDTLGATPSSETYLREAAVKYLTEEGKDALYDFLVQLYVDDEKTPIENPMQEWKEEDSPFTKIATITIPAQKFDFAERERLDEALSFSPWHTLPEHEPLGSVNLARKQVYRELVKARREYAQHRAEEPQTYSSIQDDPQ